MNKTLNGTVFFIRGLMFWVCNQEGLWEDGGIEDIVLTAREGSRENLTKMLTVKTSRMRGGGVG